MLTLNLPPYPAKIIEEEGKKQIFDLIRQKYVALTPEEWVRQNFVSFLITEKDFPKSLIANEVGIKLNNTSKRCDTVVYDINLKPLLLIEYKAPNVAVTESVFNQIIRYNMTLQVKYMIVSNGMEHYCCSIDYRANTHEFLKNIPNYYDL